MPYAFNSEETFDLIKDGDYEVILSAEIKKNKDGKPYISCSFKIRNDVEQEYKNRNVFDNIWPDKNRPSEFDHAKLQKLLLVQGKEGKYNFEDDEELVQFMNGLAMIIHINEKPSDEYHLEKYNEVKYLSYKPTKVKPQVIGKTNETESKNLDSIEINDDDLPF